MSSVSQVDPHLSVLDGFDLNESRLNVATSPESHLLVLAGPGAGKTHLLVARACWSAASSEGRVVLLTFSRRAAEEMHARVKTALDTGRRGQVVARTLHSHAMELLRTHGHRVGLRPDLVVLESDDVNALAAECAAELRTDPVPDFAERLERFRRLGGRVRSLNSAEGPLVRAADARMREQGVVDYGGVIRWAANLLEEDAEVRASVHHHDRHVLLDEAQDCDPVQLQLLSQLLGKDSRLLVAMDPDQSLYAWRQADPVRVLRWAREYEPKEHQLTENYRCSGRIAALGQWILHPADMDFSSQEGRAEVWRFSSTADEAGTVLSEVLRHEGSDLSQIAVLSRAGWRQEEFIAAAKQQNIPLRTSAAGRLTDAEAQVFAALALVSSWVGGSGTGSLHQLPAQLLDLSSEQVRSIEAEAAIAGVHPVELLEGNSTWDALRPLAQELRSVPQLVRAVASVLGAHDDELEALLTLAASCDALGELVRRVERGASKERPSEASALMVTTFHGAKGLEFDTVFVLGCEDGLVPHHRARHDLTPERRALYVAVTRAAERVVVSWCNEVGGRAKQVSRILPGSTSSVWSATSPPPLS